MCQTKVLFRVVSFVVVGYPLNINNSQIYETCETTGRVWVCWLTSFSQEINNCAEANEDDIVFILNKTQHRGFYSKDVKRSYTVLVYDKDIILPKIEIKG